MAKFAQAAQCWRSLKATLSSVHEFTSGATTAAGLLLHRMNAVLRAAVDTNFGAVSYDSVNKLYELIGGQHPDVVVRNDELPFCLFCRSFVVVLEEAVRQSTGTDETSRNEMACKVQSVECRRGLSATLRAVHEFAASATTAAGQLLHRMNAVLSAVVDSNFGTASYDSIGALYELIDREQPGMIERCEDLPLLLFARSFAVVLDEAVRQRTTRTATVLRSVQSAAPVEPSRAETPVLDGSEDSAKATVPRCPDNEESVWSCDTPNEDQLIYDGYGEENEKATVLPCLQFLKETPVLGGSEEDLAAVPNIPDNTASESSWSCDTPNEATLIIGAYKEPPRPWYAASDPYYNWTPDVTPAVSTERLFDGVAVEDVSHATATVPHCWFEDGGTSAIDRLPTIPHCRFEDDSQATATVPHCPQNTASEGSWSCDTPTEDQLIFDENENETKKEEESKPATLAAEVERRRRELPKFGKHARFFMNISSFRKLLRLTISCMLAAAQSRLDAAAAAAKSQQLVERAAEQAAASAVSLYEFRYQFANETKVYGSDDENEW